MVDHSTPKIVDNSKEIQDKEKEDFMKMKYQMYDDAAARKRWEDRMEMERLNVPKEQMMDTRPLKHALPDGEAHTHGTNKNASFDTDTDEKDFSRRDRKTYVRTKKDKKKKSDNYDMVRSTTVNTEPKKKDGTFISRAWKNRPRYKVRFNNSPMIPGFVSIKRK